MKQIIFTSFLATILVSLVECFIGSLQGLPVSGFSGLFIAKFIIFLPLILIATVVYHAFLKKKLQNNRNVFNRLFIILILVLTIGGGLLGWAFIDSQIFSYQLDSSPVKNVFKIFLKNYGNSVPAGLLIAVILPLLYTWVSAKTSKN